MIFSVVKPKSISSPRKARKTRNKTVGYVTWFGYPQVVGFLSNNFLKLSVIFVCFVDPMIFMG